MTALDFHAKNKATRLALLTAAVVGLCAPAMAVDIENADRRPYDITINRADGSSETLKLLSGQRLENICTDCVVLVGDESIESRGTVTIRIQSGKLSLKPAR